MIGLVALRAASDLAALVMSMAEDDLAGLALFGETAEKPDCVAGDGRVDLKCLKVNRFSSLCTCLRASGSYDVCTFTPNSNARTCADLSSSY